MKVEHATLANALVRDMGAIDVRAVEIQRTVAPAAFDWVPATGGWSVGQVFEHLCVADDDYLRVLRPLVAKLPSRPSPRSGLTWRPSLVGGFLARSMVSPRKLPAPKIWKPAPAPRANVVDEFLARQKEIVQLIERSAGHEWNRMRLASPVSPLIRMNAGDAFTVIVRHTQRHFRQIDDRLTAFGAVHEGREVAAR